MAANYSRLWKLLIDRQINKTALREWSGISTGTLAKLGKNECELSGIVPNSDTFLQK